MRRLFVAMLMTATGAFSQTRIGLSDQSQRIDFSGAPSTKTIRTGSAVPATCSSGELFFHVTAALGNNLLACVNTNTWVAQGAVLNVQNGGAVVGANSTLNYATGLGLITTIVDAGQRINVQHNIDTAIIQTHEAAQAGSALFCDASSSDGVAFTCSLTTTLSAYTAGMVLHWRPAVSGVGGATTLSVDTLPAKSVTLADGLSTPTQADIRAGELQFVWYDGSKFRLISRPSVFGTTAPFPACDATLRGRLWHRFGVASEKDQVSVCAKDAADSYAWRVVY